MCELMESVPRSGCFATSSQKQHVCWCKKYPENVPRLNTPNDLSKKSLISTLCSQG